MIPRFTEFYVPVLRLLSDVSQRDINVIIEDVANMVGLSETDKAIKTNGGTQPRYRSNISWALTDLSQGGFIERKARGVYVITMEGLELLENIPVHPDREWLSAKSNKFKDFLSRQGSRKNKKNSSKLAQEDEQTSIFESSKEEDGWNEMKSNEESDKVTLAELYQTRDILKRANLSIDEVEDKIKRLEQGIYIKGFISDLNSVFNKFVSLTGTKESIIVEYSDQDRITIRIGNVKKVYGINEHKEPEKVNRAEAKIGLSHPSSELFNNQEEDFKIKRRGKKKEDKSEKYKKHSSRGVWLKPYSDRLFAIYGDTEPHTKLFQSYGGKEIKNGTDDQCWIFLNGKRAAIQKDLKEFIIAERAIDSFSMEINNTESIKKKVKSIKSNDASQGTNDDLLSSCITKLDNLKSFTFLGISGPHKAVLLLALFYLVRTKAITSNEIEFTENLENVYNSYWLKLFGSEPTLGASYPFVHLGKDLILTHTLIKSIHNYDKTWNRQEIRRYIKISSIDKKLFASLSNKEMNSKLRDFIIDRYCASSFNDGNSRSQKQIFCNHKDGFKDFMLSPSSHLDRTISQSSLSTYLGILNNDYFEEKVGLFHPMSDILEIK